MTFILLRVYTFIIVFMGSLLSFYQSKKRKSDKILHTGTLRATSWANVVQCHSKHILPMNRWKVKKITSFSRELTECHLLCFPKDIL